MPGYQSARSLGMGGFSLPNRSGYELGPSAIPDFSGRNREQGKSGILGILDRGADWARKNPDIALAGAGMILNAWQQNKARKEEERRAKEIEKLIKEREAEVAPMRADAYSRIRNMGNIDVPQISLRDRGNAYYGR